MDCFYRLAGRYRNAQRRYGLLDASYDIELGPVRTTRDGMPRYAPSSHRTRDLVVGEAGLPAVAIQRKKFCTNRIKTTKYTPINFLFLFLFEQFRKAANCFFLLVSLLQLIPGVSPTGRFTTSGPLSVILTFTALKEIYEDWRRRNQDKLLNEKLVEVLKRSDHGSLYWDPTQWRRVQVGNILRLRSDHDTVTSPDIPSDILILSTSESETGTCTITTKNLDGETNLKSKQALMFIHNKLNGEDADKGERPDTKRVSFPDATDVQPNQEQIVLSRLSALADGRLSVNCECPHKNMEAFKGQLKDESSGDVLPLTIENLLLRECRLENTEWVIGAAVYTGPESKISLNNKKAPLKQSSIEVLTNQQIFIIFCIMLVMALACLSGSFYFKKHGGKGAWYVPKASETSVVDHAVLQVMLDYATFFILFNNLVPISLLVTLEFVKLAQAYFINNDPAMEHEGILANARTSNLNEELGRVKHVFSDKTGTLTQNMMVFKQCLVNGANYSVDTGFDKESVSDYVNNKSLTVLDDFLTMMAVCNTVQPHKGAHLGFIASSPDEHALAVGAKSLGYNMTVRGSDGITLELSNGSTRKIVPKHVVPFDSDRKRMSLVAEMRPGVVHILTKGADSTMRPLLGDKAEKEFVEHASERLLNYSRDGLRTLVFASRELTSDELDELNTLLMKISDPNTRQEEKNILDRDYEELVGRLESNLNLVGCSAVEDKLQDGVPEAIAKLRQADCNVWMLTGDKLETAHEIALSCKLFGARDEGFIVHKLQHVLKETTEPAADKDAIRDNMRKIVADVNQNPSADHGLIFEGAVLKQLGFSPKEAEICQEFYEFSQLFKSVAACRLEPLQKADLVDMTKTHAKKEITLAIGDGANDVPMIQAAHVGVGIQGQEGLQAVLSSDYSIAQFRFLLRLLLIHGHFSYLRVSNTILYSFYKNITLYFINLWYQFYAGFTGQPCFERITLTLFNIMFTSFPLFTLGILDRPVSEQQMLDNVKMYKTSQDSTQFNVRVFWMWCGNAVTHSLLIFFTCLFVSGEDITLPGAEAIGVFSFGDTVYCAVVFVVTLKLMLITSTFYGVSVLLIVVTGFVSWFFWFTVSSYTYMLTPDAEGFVQTLGGAPYFWATFVLATAVALYRDTVYKGLKTNLWPSMADNVRRGLDVYGHKPQRPADPSGMGETAKNCDSSRFQIITAL